jgi:hypothetical protein
MSEDCIPEARSMTPLLVLIGARLALDGAENADLNVE